MIDDEVFKYINVGDNRPYLCRDTDGLWFIDPFEFEASCPGATELAADGYDPREIYFVELGKHIEIGLTTAVRVDHKAKWQWLKNRYDSAFQYHQAGGKTSFLRALEMIEKKAAADEKKRS